MLLCKLPAWSSKNASFPMKATKLCDEGRCVVGSGHLGLFSKSAQMGSVSGLGDALMNDVGNITNECFSLSMPKTVPEPVILAGILQVPTGSSRDTSRGLN